MVAAALGVGWVWRYPASRRNRYGARDLRAQHPSAFERIFQGANASSPTRSRSLAIKRCRAAQEVFTDADLSVREESRTKGADSILLLWQVAGKPSAHRQVCDLMIRDPTSQGVRSLTGASCYSSLQHLDSN